MNCEICPRSCNIDRTINKGSCNTGDRLKVAKAFSHMWEEPCISGTKGSGTIFFSGCNMRCIFCQNYEISQQGVGIEISKDKFTNIIMRLQDLGVHNINLVNPTHFVYQIRKVLLNSNVIQIPLVYNSGGYDTLEGLRLMEGLVNVYLPDLKYINNATALKYSGISNYVETAMTAIKEMYRQSGPVIFDQNGLIKSGLVIRHLVLPGYITESLQMLEWIKDNFKDDIVVSIMSQYTPVYMAENDAVIGRRITRREYEKVVSSLIKLDFEHCYIQERSAASVNYIPSFDLSGI